jgi:hypothetical protein
MDKRKKWFNKTAYQKEKFDVSSFVYTKVKEINVTFLRIVRFDLFFYKELEIIFANIRV